MYRETSTIESMLSMQNNDHPTGRSIQQESWTMSSSARKVNHNRANCRPDPNYLIDCSRPSWIIMSIRIPPYTISTWANLTYTWSSEFRDPREIFNFRPQHRACISSCHWTSTKSILSDHFSAESWRLPLDRVFLVLRLLIARPADDWPRYCSDWGSKMPNVQQYDEVTSSENWTRWTMLPIYAINYDFTGCGAGVHVQIFVNYFLINTRFIGR